MRFGGLTAVDDVSFQVGRNDALLVAAYLGHEEVGL